MGAILSTVFLASLAGSLHCVGMCGPFALMCAARREGNWSSAWGTAAAFNAGRLALYALAGCVAGGIGLLVEWSGSMAGLQRSAAWLAGGLMILAGLARLVPWQRVAHGAFPPRAWLAPLQRLLHAAKRLPPASRAAVFGAVTSLMPCGWLYVFVIAAAGTGSPWSGGLLMVTFWLGTLPALVGLMLGAAPLGPRIVARIPTVMAVVMIGLGVYTAWGRGSIDLHAAGLPTGTPGEVLTHVAEVDPHALPCCQSCQEE